MTCVSSHQFGLLYANGEKWIQAVLILLHGCRGQISSNPPGGVTVRPPVNPGDGTCTTTCTQEVTEIQIQMITVVDFCDPLGEDTGYM